MKNFIRLLLCMILAIMAISCNQLSYDLAEKKGVKFLARETLTISGKVSSAPVSISAFLWPSEEYFERRQKSGLEKDDHNYQSYIEQLAATIFLASDEFDEWSLRYLYEGKEMERSLEQINEEKKPLLAQVTAFSRTLRNLKKQSKALEKNLGDVKNDIVKKIGEVQEAQMVVQELKRESSLIDCPDTSDKGVSHNLVVTCQELQLLLEKAQEDLSLKRAQLVSLRETKTEKENQFQQVTTQTEETRSSKEIFKKGELAVLKKREEDLDQQLDEMSANRLKRVTAIQMALDPYAVSFEYDEDGDVLLNGYGDPKITINPKAQVNWLKVDQNSSGEDNELNIGEDRIDIRLGAWGAHHREYKTTYQKSEEGQWELSPDSSLYDVSFSSDEILKFKFREKDAMENLTGRVFEFQLQRSPFGPLIRFAGDIVVTLGGEVVRKGQMKVLFSVSKEDV